MNSQDPRFFQLFHRLNLARNAADAHDEQSILEHLYHLRELAWDINSDILAQRWAAYEAAKPRRQPIIRTITTVDDLMA